MTTQSNVDKLRLWVLPWGLYPRRVTIYAKEKGINDNLEIIHVPIGQDGKLASVGQPPGTLPILEIEPGQYIYQSLPILEYLEELYPDTGLNLIGASAKAKSQTRQGLAVLEEAVSFLSCYWHNASPLFASLEKQAPETAEWALARANSCLDKLESYAAQGPFLLGETPSLVDVVLLSTAQFGLKVYGTDITANRTKLARAVEAFETRPGGEEDGLRLVPEPILAISKIV